MRKFLAILVVASVFLCDGCGRKTETPFSIEQKDGIEYVHNAASPTNPDCRISFATDLSIEPKDQEGNIRIYQPAAFNVDAKGFIYICDYKEPSVKVFDSQGDFVRTIGRKGNGPGEFENAGTMAILPDGRLLVLDWELMRVSIFSHDGQFIESHQCRYLSFDIFLATDSSYIREDTTFEPGQTSMSWKSRLHVKAYDLSGRELFSYGEFQAPQSGFVNEEGRRFSFSLPFEVRSILTGDSKNGRLYHCLSDKYLIEVFDEKGRLFRKIDRPYERLRVTDEDKKKYLDGFGDSEIDRALIAKNAVMPAFRPITDRMIVDDSGNLWVKLSEEREDKGQTFIAYDIFDGKGIYVYKVWCDIAPDLFRNGKMYTLEAEKDTGERVLKRYRVLWSD
jgi:hypothetical protein